MSDYRRVQVHAAEEELAAARRLAEVLTRGQDLAVRAARDASSQLDGPVDPARADVLWAARGRRMQLESALHDDSVATAVSKRNVTDLANHLGSVAASPTVGTFAPDQAVAELDGLLDGLRRQAASVQQMWAELQAELMQPELQAPDEIGARRTQIYSRELTEMSELMTHAAGNLARAEMLIGESCVAAQQFGQAVTAALWKNLTGQAPPVRPAAIDPPAAER